MLGKEAAPWTLFEHIMLINDAGKVVANLQRGEGKVLRAMIERQGKPVSKETISRKLWGWVDADWPLLGDKVIQVRVCSLRRKLKDTPFANAIKVIYGYGYLFEGPPSVPKVLIKSEDDEIREEEENEVLVHE